MSSAAFFRIHRDDRVFRLLFYRRCVSHRFRPRPQPRPSGPARCSPTAPRPGHAALVHVRPCPGRVRPSVPPQRARPWACAGTAGLPRALGLCELPPGSLAHAAGRAASAPRADAAKPELAGWFLRPVPEVTVTREGSSWLLLSPGTHRLPRSLGSNKVSPFGDSAVTLSSHRLALPPAECWSHACLWTVRSQTLRSMKCLGRGWPGPGGVSPAHLASVPSERGRGRGMEPLTPHPRSRAGSPLPLELDGAGVLQGCPGETATSDWLRAERAPPSPPVHPAELQCDRGTHRLSAPSFPRLS